MAEPPHKRARRPDSKQMWDESDKRAPIQSRERDEPRRDDRDRQDDRDKRDDRDRNRRYRSRSPRDLRDSRSGRDRDRERGRDSRGGRDSRDVRGSGKGRDDLDARRDRERDGDRNRGRGGNRDRDAGRDSRDKPRDGSRSRDTERRRSRSPRGERETEGRHEKLAKVVTPEEEFTKSRTATPPVSFKVGGDHDRMDTDGESKVLHTKGSARKPKEKVEAVPIEDDEEIVIEDDGMAAMQAMMGFGGFGTTHQKKVPGNDVSAVRKEKKTEYRQYMNRVGGFNRPLSPTREP